MSLAVLGQVALFILGIVFAGLEWRRSRGAEGSAASGRWSLMQWALAVLSLANLALLLLIMVNHSAFPLNLEVMEGTVLQHFERASSGQPVYPVPSAAYVPLAYNPLYYYLAVPFGWVFGVNLFTLRWVAILAVLGSALLIYRIVREKTSSAWWGIVAVGLFAAAYRVMDAYLDTAHSDSWLLCFILLGSYLIDRSRSWSGELLGLGVLVAAFWTKQHGALFVVGGVLFLSWRTYRALGLGGLRKIASYWLLAGVLGPGLFLLAGPTLFGERFLYFTWEVPSAWTAFETATVVRYGLFILQYYLFLALAGGLFTLWVALRRWQKLDIWHVQFVFALLSGFLGALDPGSSNNVFIPMGAWFILLGTLGLHQLAALQPRAQTYQVPLLLLFFSFALFFYDPRPQLTSFGAQADFDEFTAYLESLGGDVYSPDIGQLQGDFKLYPNAHWVALEDLIRGTDAEAPDDTAVRELLEPVAQPQDATYILTYRPLESRPYLAFLQQYYVLETDLGERFAVLGTTPHRWDIGYPRYLYRYAPDLAAAP